MRVTFARRCAWRAIYLSTNGSQDWGPFQFAHLGVDPNNGSRPQVFGEFPFWARRTCTGRLVARVFRFRLPLPRIPWGWCMATKYARPVVWAYSLSHRFWHRVDGRY